MIPVAHSTLPPRPPRVLGRPLVTATAGTLALLLHLVVAVDFVREEEPAPPYTRPHRRRRCSGGGGCRHCRHRCQPMMPPVVPPTLVVEGPAAVVVIAVAVVGVAGAGIIAHRQWWRVWFFGAGVAAAVVG